MSTHLSCLRRSLLASCAVLLTTAAAADAAATRKGADLRVVAEGVTLVDQRQYTGTARVRTSPKADCFGEGTGGSGKKTRVAGANALGILRHAQLSKRSLRPLRVTDHFDFGLGLCGIGGFEPPANGFWYLKRNHAEPPTGGDATKLGHGDQVLWYLIEDFEDPTPAELEIKAPARVKQGESIPVRAFEYAGDGTRTPAAGVQLRGTGQTTGANWRAEVPSDGAITRFRGVRDGAIPSNLLKVCSSERLRDCPRGHLTKQLGTNRRDKIKGTRGPDKISALGGNDRIDVRRARRSSPPIIRCGRGKDKVIARTGQKLIKRGSCEKVKRV